MATDYGTDLVGVTDIDPSGLTVTGTQGLAQSLGRRLTTPRGGLVYDSDYGTDLRAWANEGLTPRRVAEMRSSVIKECLKDERVFDVDADFTFNSPAQTFSASIRIAAAVGTFTLRLNVSQLTVTLLPVS